MEKVTLKNYKDRDKFCKAIYSEKMTMEDFLFSCKTGRVQDCYDNSDECFPDDYFKRVRYLRKQIYPALEQEITDLYHFMKHSNKKVKDYWFHIKEYYGKVNKVQVIMFDKGRRHPAYYQVNVYDNAIMFEPNIKLSYMSYNVIDTYYKNNREFIDKVSLDIAEKIVEKFFR